ncbi:MAG: dipeptidase [Thermoanaerobaculia bacterium]
MRLVSLALIAIGILSAACASSTPPEAEPASPQSLHERALVIDGHCDTPSEYMQEPFDLSAERSSGHIDYARMRSGGLDAAFFVAYVPAEKAEHDAAAYCLKIIDTIHQMVDHYPRDAGFAASTADIRTITDTGKRAILIGVEGGHAIEDSLEILRSFYRLGARYMTLTHSNNNHWADSSGAKGEHGGLTDFGRQVVREMNRIGMMVDVSHVSDETFWDVIETTRAPVIASHSSARALADHPRNMTDDMLAAVGKNGGVVMVIFFPLFISKEYETAWEARSKALATEIDALKKKHGDHSKAYWDARQILFAQHPIPPVPMTVVADHIDHMVRVAGIDHVGLGSDFDGISSTPAGLEDVSRLPALTAELQRRGYTDEQLRKILGENFMRVFADVERVAKDSVIWLPPAGARP